MRRNYILTPLPVCTILSLGCTDQFPRPNTQPTVGTMRSFEPWSAEEDFAIAKVRSAGTAIEPFEGEAEVLLASNCSRESSVNVGIQGMVPGASGGVSEIWAGDAFNQVLTRPSEATSMGLQELERHNGGVHRTA